MRRYGKRRRGFRGRRGRRMGRRRFGPSRGRRGRIGYRL